MSLLSSEWDWIPTARFYGPVRQALRPPPGSFYGIALDEPLVQEDADCNSNPGIPAVVQVIAVPEVVDIHIIVVIPVVSPVFWPRVNDTEPKATVLKSGISANNYQREAVDAEPVTRTKVTTETDFRNVVAVVAATLLPGAVFGLPATCAMLLPHAPPFSLLHTLPLL